MNAKTDFTSKVPPRTYANRREEQVEQLQTDALMARFAAASAHTLAASKPSSTSREIIRWRRGPSLFNSASVGRTDQFVRR